MVNLVNFADIEGGTNHQISLFQSWRERGHSVSMISPFRRRKDGAPAEKIDGIYYSPSLSYFNTPKVFDTFIQIPYIIIERILQKKSLLYIRANIFTVFIVVTAKIIGLKVVVEHNSWCSSERKIRSDSKALAGAERLSQVWSAKIADASRCVTQGIADKLLQEGVPEHRLFVLGNGTDLEKFHPLDRNECLETLHLDPKPTWLGFIGILTKWQGVETAIRALTFIRAKQDVRLIIAGDGPELEPLKNLANSLDIADSIVFLGHVAPEKANQVINCFDLALAPFTAARNQEIGLSALKIRDYAAAGRTVLASSISGVEELSDRGWLFTHRPDDPEDCAAKALKILGTINERGTSWSAARRDAEALFDWSAIAKTLEEHFRRL